AIRKCVDAWQVKPIPDDDQTIVFVRIRPLKTAELGD
ncbi:MAG: hypothetical protein JWM57_3140, partial [Phycisphaerales bacterium]|nr:hypothetical protein [Phycisphaerales bacterium]